MNIKRKKPTVGTRQPLVKKLLLIEGISRSGKFLLANVISGLKDIEPVQAYGLLEHIPFFQKFGLIDKKTAQEILQCEIDTHCYEMLIGRNFNHRKFDKSSIFNNPQCREYLKRCREKDDDRVIRKFHKNKWYSLFIMHELIPNIGIYFDTFSRIKIISIQRSPVDLVFSWYKRGLSKRLANDSKLFMIPFQVKDGMIPWYALSFKNKYRSLSEIDRTILSIETLFKMYKVSYNKLPLCYKNKILFTSYENVLNNPREVIKKISKFLDKKQLPEMKQVLRKEKLPNRTLLNSQKNKIKEIKKLASDKYFKRLISLEEKYKKQC